MRSIHEYCDIAGMSAPGASRPCFFAHDGATCSILRVRGMPTLVSEEDAVQRMSDVLQALSGELRDKGHALTVTYERHYNIEEDVRRLVDPLRDATRRKGLALEGTIDESEAILRRQIVSTRILIAVWTHPGKAQRAQYAEDKRIRRDTMGRLPLSRRVQDPNGPWESLQAAHNGFVQSLDVHLQSLGFVAHLLGDGAWGREDLAEARRALLFHETPPNWAPRAAGLVRYPAVKAKADQDVAEMFADTIDRQIMTSAAHSGGAKKNDDLRTVSLGGRRYAVARLIAFPQRLTAFRALLRGILGGGAGLDRMPFRVAFHIEGGASIGPVVRFLTTLGSAFSTANKRIKIAFDGIEDYMAQDHANFVNMRIYAATWTEVGEGDRDELLEARRSRLVRALTGWHSPTVTDTASDPLRLLVETAPGLTAVPRTGKTFIAPASEAGYAMPFHADAPLEDAGETVFATLDNSPFPIRAHSPLQTSWFSLIFAPPGGGKSVLLNTLNLDFAAFFPAARLPYIGIIEVGESSVGLVDTARAALPVERRDEVAFVTMRNELRAADHFINPFDIGLGRRTPLQREKTFVQNFLKAMAAVEDPGVDALVETVVEQLYTQASDLAVSSQAKTYVPDQDPAIDVAMGALGLKVHDHLTWWTVVDTLAAGGRFDLAERAQRRAMPVLTDVISKLSESNMRRRFGHDLCQRVQVQVESAINMFPAFANWTTLDIGRARIVAIDLKPVVNPNPLSEADKRSNLLFFMMARELFIKKVAGDEGEIGHMNLPPEERGEIYVRYWRERCREVATTRKRFCFDEFHITGQSPIMAQQIDQDVRQGRKWGLEIVLVSQKLEDFDAYHAMASTFFVLKAPDGQAADHLRHTMSLNDAAMSAMQAYVKGPVPGVGSIIMIQRRLKGIDTTLLARNQIGPMRLWAFGTEQEDRALRAALYRRTDVEHALRLLARSFPDGSCKRVWAQAASELPAGVDVADHLAGELLSRHVLEEA